MADPSTLRVTHAIGIAGQVTDQVTGAAVPGAQVAIVTGPAAFEAVRAYRPDAGAATARADGSYYFVDLPAGQYHLRASLLRPQLRPTDPPGDPRYGPAELDQIQVFAVGAGGAGDNAGQNRLDVNFALPPTRISGRVLRKSDNQPIAGAIVRLRGDTNIVTTGADGHYELNGLVAVAPMVEAQAAKFKTATQAVTLAPGQNLALDLLMEPA